MTPEFWRNKTVLVTGHTGFKGSWLCLWLQSHGANVIGYALCPQSKPNLFEIAHIHERIISVKGDVRNLADLCSVIKGHQPEIVIHLAAQALVRSSYRDPVETYSTNVMGTVNILEALRSAKSVRVAIIVTSDKCYENTGSDKGYREGDPMGGFDPYSSSKGCAELVTSAYRRSFFADSFTHIASARGGNVIGGGDWSQDRLVPDAIASILEGKPVLVRNPKAVRPWQHVLEPLNGYLALAEAMWNEGANYAEGWNFGPNESDCKSVEYLVDRITRLWDEGASWDSDKSSHPHEAGLLKLDCSKARQGLNWRPRWDLDRSLSATVEWYKSWYAGHDGGELVLRQIKDYESCR
jgi:CDP-glucose 4,6-dehydratase